LRVIRTSADSPDEKYQHDPRTTYLWRGKHGKYLTDIERRLRVESIEDVWQLMPATGFVPEYIRHWLPTTDAPVIFHLAGALTTAASLLHRRIWIMQGGDKIHPILWSVLLATSTKMKKSTCAKAVIPSLPATHKDILLPQSFTLVSFVAKMGVTEDTEEKLNETLRIRVNQLSAHPNTLDGVGLLLVHELSGLLASLGEAYNRGAEEMLHYLYDGLEWKHITKTQGCSGITGAHLNILAASTPDWLSRATKEWHIGGGFYPRWMFFYADRQDYTLSVRDAPAVTQLTNDTDQLIKMTGGEKRLSDAAEDYYDGWYRRLSQGAGEEMGGWAQRLAVNALKVALLYEASTTNDEEVSVENIQLACRLIDRIAKDTNTILEGELTFNAKDELTKKVRKFIREKADVPWRDICRQFHRHPPKNLKLAVDALIEQGEVESHAGPQGGAIYSWKEP
jgi:hypothetical protein